MKRFVLFGLMIMCALGINAQVEENGDYTEIIDSLNMSKDDIYRFSREYLATTFPDFQKSVQLEDKENGKIISNVAIEKSMHAVSNGTWLYVGTQNWKLTLDCRDGKVRVKFTEFDYPFYVHGFGNANNLLHATYETLKKEVEGYDKQYIETLQNITKGLKAYIIKTKAEDDF